MGCFCLGPAVACPVTWGGASNLLSAAVDCILSCWKPSRDAAVMGIGSGEKKSIPSWLNRKFIASTLKQGDPATDESSVQLKSVSHVGGGLVSETFRVVAQSRVLGEACDRETSVIVKSSPVVGGFIKELADSGVFKKETVAYCNFLPTVDAALMAVEGQSWKALAPKFYHCGSQPTSFLVVEDLVAAGFHQVAMGVSLDVDQCRAVLRNLARMHAASVALLHEQPYTDQLFHQALVFSQRLVDTCQKNEPKDTNQFAFLDDYTWFRKYKDKLDQTSKRFVIEAVDAVEQCRVDFKVMLHGDLHKNNMMFREDGDDLLVRFFDFQGVHVGSPAEDLQYFLHSSASLEVLRHHLDHLLVEYHSTLQRTLRALGLHSHADAFPLHKLRQDMDHFGMVAVFVTFAILPVMLNFGDIDFAMDTTDARFKEKSLSFYERSCRDSRYIKYLEHLLPVFDSKGFLDQKV